MIFVKDKEYDCVDEVWDMNEYSTFKFKLPFINYGIFKKRVRVPPSLGWFTNKSSMEESYCIRNLSKMREHTRMGKWIGNRYVRVDPKTGEIE